MIEMEEIAEEKNGAATLGYARRVKVRQAYSCSPNSNFPGSTRTG
jgi:hypothetical protein